MSWLMKVKRYGGGVSVMARESTKEFAQLAADDWNSTYQTDTAYVEEYDPAKSEWTA